MLSSLPDVIDWHNAHYITFIVIVTVITVSINSTKVTVESVKVFITD